LIGILRVDVEVAGYALIGQGILALISGKSLRDTVVYPLMQALTRPVTGPGRLITPRFVLDRNIPVVVFFLLFWLWIVLAIVKRYAYVMQASGRGMKMVGLRPGAKVTRDFQDAKYRRRLFVARNKYVMLRLQ
jgi:hypothetical protein